MKVLVIHGPNLNLLGTREPEVYGRTSLEAVNAMLEEEARNIGVDLECYQSNSEGDLITAVQNARGRVDTIILNAAAYTHTSVALRDAVSAAEVPTIEVHLSNLASREPFRHQSTISQVVVGRIEGLGPESYRLAMRFIIGRLTGHE